MAQFLDYMLCIPYWVAAFYSGRTFWNDRNNVQAKYAFLMLSFMGFALTLTMPVIFRAIGLLLGMQNIARLIIDHFALLSVYYFYALLGEVHPPYQRHKPFILLHLIFVYLVLNFSFFHAKPERELLFTVDCGGDNFNFLSNIAFISFWGWSSIVGFIHFFRQAAIAQEFTLKVRLWLIYFTCFLTMLYGVLKIGALVVVRFSPSHFPGLSFFVGVKIIPIVVGILAGLILSMPRYLERLILFFYDFMVLRALYQDLYLLASSLEDARLALQNQNRSQKSYYIFILGKRLGLSDEELQQCKEACALIDLRKGRDLPTPEEELSDVRWNLINRSLTRASNMKPDLLKQLYFFHNLYKISRYIDENYDGSGQPSGMKGDNIPLGARIIRIVSYYVEHNNSLREEQVLAELQENSGRLFDPLIVQTFFEIVREEELEKCALKSRETTI